MPIPPKSILSKLDFQGRHWIWLGEYDDSGNSVVEVDGEMISATKHLYEFFNEKITDDIDLVKTCSIEGCCSPTHHRLIFKPLPRYKQSCILGHEYAHGSFRIRKDSGEWGIICLRCEEVGKTSVRILSPRHYNELLTKLYPLSSQ